MELWAWVFRALNTAYEYVLAAFRHSYSPHWPAPYPCHWWNIRNDIEIWLRTPTHTQKKKSWKYRIILSGQAIFTVSCLCILAAALIISMFSNFNKNNRVPWEGEFSLPDLLLFRLWGRIHNDWDPCCNFPLQSKHYGCSCCSCHINDIWKYAMKGICMKYGTGGRISIAVGGYFQLCLCPLLDVTDDVMYDTCRTPECNSKIQIQNVRRCEYCIWGAKC